MASYLGAKALKALAINAIAPPWPFLTLLQRENAMEQLIAGPMMDDGNPDGIGSYGMGADIQTTIALGPGAAPATIPTQNFETSTLPPGYWNRNQNNAAQDATSWITALTGGIKDVMGVVNPPKTPTAPKAPVVQPSSSIPWTPIAIGAGVLVLALVAMNRRK